MANPLAAQKQWSLNDCIDHALQHNISLQKAQQQVQTQRANLYETKGALLPSLTAHLQQGFGWNPIAEGSGSHTSYSGSYGVNAAWTVWNAGRNRLGIESAEKDVAMSELAVETSGNAIVEKIAGLYIQVLYMEEAAKVNEQLLQQDSTIHARGVDMVSHGQMSRSDLVQLEAQVAEGRYAVVHTRTQIDQVKLQLKQLLELAPEEAFEVATLELSDAAALRGVPDRMDVYRNALALRPEVKSGQLAIEQSGMATRIAEGRRLPTVSLTGSLGDSHLSGSARSLGTQLRNNLAANVGIGVSIPIFDNRQSRSAIARAKVAEVTAALDLEETKKQVYQSVESYWLNATNHQQKFLAARKNTESAAMTYALIQDQFNLGTKNVVELLQSRASLLNAQQQMLQDKYTAVLNLMLLDFYNSGEMTL